MTRDYTSMSSRTLTEVGSLPRPKDADAKICVVGNLNIDLLLRGLPDLPKWGQEVIGSSSQSYVAGQAGYLAMCLAALQTPVSVVGAVGGDEAGRHILTEMTQAGIDISGVVQHAGGRTGLTIGLVRADGERAFASDIGCTGEIRFDDIVRADQVLCESWAVGVVGLFMMPNLPFDRLAERLAECRRNGQLTFLDTGWDSNGWQPQTVKSLGGILAETDLFLPNLDEARAITGITDPKQALLELGNRCPGIVIVKNGAEGSLLLQGGRVESFAAIPVDIVDAVGAGDCFDAGLLTAIRHGASVEDAVRFGHLSASRYVSTAENRFASLSDLRPPTVNATS